MPAFETAEYRERTRRLRALMAEKGMDALLVMSESHMNYITGYDGYSEYLPQCALVLQEEEDPYLLLREMDLECAYPTSYLARDRILSYPERYIGTKTATPWEPIAQMVRDRTRSQRIGVELTAKGYGIKAHAALTAALGAKDVVDGDGLFARLRVIKSPAEIAYIAQAGRIVDRAMQTAMLTIDVGARECDVAAAVTQALIAGTPEYPGHACRNVTMPVGPVATAPHLKWTDRRYTPNSQTNFEIGAFRYRYVCPLSRTIYLGEPPARLRHIHDAVLAGFEAAFQTMKPGATSGDVDKAFRAAFNPYGVRKESRIGYSFGLDWGDGGASLQADDPTILQPNMTFHLIIGIWEHTEGYVFSEAVRITETGAESFSRMPRHLLVNS